MSENGVKLHEAAEVQQIIQVYIRWMIRRDMAEVLRIERESFDFNWTEEDFLACLRQRNCIGMVAEGMGGAGVNWWAERFWRARGGGQSTPEQQLADYQAGCRQTETENRVIGFMIYELHKTRLRILNFAVSPAYRRGPQLAPKWWTSWSINFPSSTAKRFS